MSSCWSGASIQRIIHSNTIDGRNPEIAHLLDRQDTLKSDANSGICGIVLLTSSTGNYKSQLYHLPTSFLPQKPRIVQNFKKFPCFFWWQASYIIQNYPDTQRVLALYKLSLLNPDLWYPSLPNTFWGSVFEPTFTSPEVRPSKGGPNTYSQGLGGYWKTS